MSDIRVDHAALGAIVERMQGTVQQMERRLDHLEGELRQARVEWTGEAAGSFEHAKGVWDQQFHEMGLLLRTLGARVDDADVAYRAADSRGAALFG